jgi:hypothetical protein
LTCAAHLALELLGERIKLVTGAAEGFGLIAQHAFGGLFDAFAKFGDAAVGLGFGLAGVVEQALVEQLFAGVEGLVGLLLAGLADGVVELLGEQRLGRLGFLDRLLHAVEELFEILTLFAEVAGDLLPLTGGGVAETGVLRMLSGLLWRVEIGQAIGEVLLLLLQLAGVLAHLGHRVVELAGGGLAHLFLELVELLGGALAGGGGELRLLVV